MTASPGGVPATRKLRPSSKNPRGAPLRAGDHRRCNQGPRHARRLPRAPDSRRPSQTRRAHHRDSLAADKQVGTAKSHRSRRELSGHGGHEMKGLLGYLLRVRRLADLGIRVCQEFAAGEHLHQRGSTQQRELRSQLGGGLFVNARLDARDAPDRCRATAQAS